MDFAAAREFGLNRPGVSVKSLVRKWRVQVRKMSMNKIRLGHVRGLFLSMMFMDSVETATGLIQRFPFARRPSSLLVFSTGYFSVDTAILEFYRGLSMPPWRRLSARNSDISIYAAAASYPRPVEIC